MGFIKIEFAIFPVTSSGGLHAFVMATKRPGTGAEKRPVS
jgi:hypothetical protein